MGTASPAPVRKSENSSGNENIIDLDSSLKKKEAAKEKVEVDRSAKAQFPKKKVFLGALLAMSFLAAGAGAWHMRSKSAVSSDLPTVAEIASESSEPVTVGE